MPYIVPDAVREPIYAVVPYFNPWRWKSREKHTTRTVKHLVDAGFVVYLVEVAFNRREQAFANSGLDGLLASCSVIGADHNFRHRYIGLRTKDELWLKENAINKGVENLPWGWEQVCWPDSDVTFIRPNIAGETIHKLQHYKFLQMFSHARDMGPNYEMLPESYPHANGVGFFRAWHDGNLDAITRTAHKPGQARQQQQPDYPYPGVPGYGGRVFPGLAWACTRQAWDEVGGLMDFAIWGGADWHMAHALIEKTQGMMRTDLHRNYQKKVMQWYYRCHTHIRRNVGYVDGSIIHAWHGKKTDRGYNAKHSLLAAVGFDPERHLKRDYQGLWQLHDDRSTAFVQLRDLMRRIAKERNEDSIDID